MAAIRLPRDPHPFRLSRRQPGSRLVGFLVRGYGYPCRTIEFDGWPIAVVRLNLSDPETDKLAFFWNRSTKCPCHSLMASRIPRNYIAFFAQRLPGARTLFVVSDARHVVVLLSQGAHYIAVNSTALHASEKFVYAPLPRLRGVQCGTRFGGKVQK